MKILEIIRELFWPESALYEMSWFDYKTTGLPTNIKIWVRSDLKDHGHNRYRVKISKNNEWSAVFTVGKDPIKIKDINHALSPKEECQIIEFIREFYPLIIQLIDSKIDSGEMSNEIKKIRGYA